MKKNILIEYIRDLHEAGELGDAIGMLLTCMTAPFAIILASAIFG